MNTKRLSDRVLIAWVGNAMQTIDVVALSTAKGIVVIETNLIRSADARIRRAIEEAFGRKDFKVLINTHYHHDHTCGNQVYADTTIIGHRDVPAGMKSELTGEGKVKLLEMFRAMLKEWGEGLAEAAPDSRDRLYLGEGVVLLKTAIEELQEGFTLTVPTVTFEKSLFVDMGDVTLELYAVGGLHTTSDIIIFVPEEGLVAVGDMIPDPMLPYLRKGGPWDLDLILENWGRVVASGREIKYVNMAHSDMDLSVATFKEQYRYLKTLWDGLREFHAQGGTLESAKTRYSIEKDFPYYKGRMLNLRGASIHENNVEAIWEKLLGAGKPASPKAPVREPGPNDPSPGDIIDKHLAAIGGRGPRVISSLSGQGPIRLAPPAGPRSHSPGSRPSFTRRSTAHSFRASTGGFATTISELRG